VLSQQLDSTDNEAVLQELQQLEDAALREEMAELPSVPAGQEQQQAVAAAAQEPRQQQAAVVAGQEEEELPSVPATKVRLSDALLGVVSRGTRLTRVACVRARPAGAGASSRGGAAAGGADAGVVSAGERQVYQIGRHAGRPVTLHTQRLWFAPHIRLCNNTHTLIHSPPRAR
jgi:hypothetical protein